MVRVAVVEDDVRSRKELVSYLQAFGKERGVSFSITEFTNGLDIAEDYKPVFDVVFLDIEMPLLDGMRTAERIREHDDQVLLLFITNLAQYAIQDYGVGALDYMLKPVTYAAFALKLQRAIRILESRPVKSLVLSQDGNTMRLPHGNIRFVEVVDHQLIYHTTQGEYREFRPLKELEGILGEGFSRIHHAYLVNLRFVEGIQDECCILGSDRLKISRAKKKVFMQQLSDYYRYGGR